LRVYDDATGKPLKKGMTLVGNPTIGIGRNLADPGLSEDEAGVLFGNDVAQRLEALAAALPFFAGLPEVRKRVLLDMSFMGVAKLLKFKRMLAAIERGEWATARREMERSKWATQVQPARVHCLGHMLEFDAEPEEEAKG